MAQVVRHRQVCTSVAHRAALVLFFALFAVGVLMSDAEARNFRRDTLTLLTAGGEKKIDIEVADNDADKAMGLMFRTTLADTAGMLFPYTPPQEIGMWMKNTYIPLDMVFIRADGIVHRIEVRTTPLSEAVISSGGIVSAVLELAGGAAERLGLRAGDRIVHPHFKPLAK